MNLKESWPSVLGVVYAVGGAIRNYYELLGHVGVDYGVAESPLVLAIGSAVTNLAYVLFFSGVARGTFKAFGLRGRVKVLRLGVITFVIGVYLSNSGLQW